VAQNRFRSYAGLGIDGQLVDVPNLFIMSCPADSAPFITMHFPTNYVLTGFTAEDWLPKTDVFVRTGKGTLRFEAELNQNEFHIDLGEKEFDWLHELWADKGLVEFKFGPANAHVTLGFAQTDDSTAKLLETKGHLAARYSFLQMRTRCQAASIAGEKAAVGVIFVYSLYKNSRKYGEAGLAFALIEAGQIAAHFHLASCAMGLKSCDIGGFRKQQIERALGLDGVSEHVVHFILAGS
jgi:hypothetical protein